jgi:hypothetical protein
MLKSQMPLSHPCSTNHMTILNYIFLCPLILLYTNSLIICIVCVAVLLSWETVGLNLYVYMFYFVAFCPYRALICTNKSLNNLYSHISDQLDAYKYAYHITVQL